MHIMRGKWLWKKKRRHVRECIYVKAVLKQKFKWQCRAEAAAQCELQSKKIPFWFKNRKEMMLSAELQEIALNVLSFHRTVFCVRISFCIELKRRRRVCLCFVSLHIWIPGNLCNNFLKVVKHFNNERCFVKVHVRCLTAPPPHKPSATMGKYLRDGTEWWSWSGFYLSTGILTERSITESDCKQHEGCTK